MKLTEKEWDWVIDVNLKGAWITARAAAEALIEAGNGGRIVTVASAAGLPGANGSTGMASYAAAKAGVIVLTQNLASELGRFGINVNAISPGMVHTQASQPVRDKLQSRGQLEDWLGGIPLRRMLRRARWHPSSRFSAATTRVSSPATPSTSLEARHSDDGCDSA